jgi:protein-ribulosamine 3-kinase
VTVIHPLLAEEVRSAIESEASRHLGRRWVADAFTDLADRASHPCGLLHGEPFSVFAKLSLDRTAGEQFRAELNGLAFLRQRARIVTPVPVGSGLVQLAKGALLLFEALSEQATEARTRDDWRSIGYTLAALHQVHDPQFGLDHFNGFFGPLAQDNRPVTANRWADFYAERRLAPRLRSAVDSGHLPMALAADIEHLQRRLPTVCGPEPQPTLLHGDAQQNNFISTDTGTVVIDAAPYFGHPEIDLALVDYFQPVPDDVFDAYREITVIDPGFTERRELWRTFGYLAVVTVDGDNPFGRRILAQLADAVRRYR